MRLGGHVDDGVGGRDAPRDGVAMGRLRRLPREHPAQRLEVAHVRPDEEVAAVAAPIGPIPPEYVGQTLQVAGVRQEIEVHDPYVWIAREHPAHKVDADEAGAAGHEYIPHVSRTSRR